MEQIRKKGWANDANQPPSTQEKSEIKLPRWAKYLIGIAPVLIIALGIEYEHQQKMREIMDRAKEQTKEKQEKWQKLLDEHTDSSGRYNAFYNHNKK